MAHFGNRKDLTGEVDYTSGADIRSTQHNVEAELKKERKKRIAAEKEAIKWKKKYHELRQKMNQFTGI
jgi:hypothetical protein